MHEQVKKNIKALTLILGSSGALISVYLAASKYQEEHDPVRTYVITMSGETTRSFPSKFSEENRKNIQNCLESRPIVNCLAPKNANEGTQRQSLTIQIR